MSTAAQDEYNDLVARNNRSQITHHPEDSFSTSDTEETVTQATNSSSTLVEPYHTSAQHSKTSLRSSKYNAHDSSDDDSDPELAARARKPTPHYIPYKHGYEERTGPKGVIADARAFERERRSGNKNTYVRTEGMVLPKMQKLHITGEEQYRRRRAGTDGAGGDEEEDEEEDDEDDEDFVRSWREKRSEEMRNGNVALSYGRRKGRYGTMRTVDAMGFLRAVDSQPSGTVVLVFVFDAESRMSGSYHAQLEQLAAKYADALFVALDYEDGEIERAGVPALLAYRNGEQTDSLTPLKGVVPASSGSEALEKILKEYVNP